MGLKAKLEPKKVAHNVPGMVVAVSPAPGTMLSPGDTVTVTVAAR